MSWRLSERRTEGSVTDLQKYARLQSAAGLPDLLLGHSLWESNVICSSIKSIKSHRFLLDTLLKYTVESKL